MKKITLLSSALIISLILCWLIFNPESSNNKYILDKNSSVTIEDVKNSKLKVNFQEIYKQGTLNNEHKTPDYFSDFFRKTDKLKFYKFLAKEFEDAGNQKIHFDLVEQFLLLMLPPEQVKEILAQYKNYTDCERDLAKEYTTWGVPDRPEEILALLSRSHEFRRDKLGAEDADSIFGAEVKSMEYAIRRASIIQDKDLYGEEKERLISSLNTDMWQDEAGNINDVPGPYIKYREKLSIYSKDLSDMPTSEQKEKIRKFREEIFTAEVVKRLENVDKIIEEERQAELSYSSEKNELISSDLDESVKNQKLLELQEEYFGDNSDSLRRREALREGLEKLKASSTPPD